MIGHVTPVLPLKAITHRRRSDGLRARGRVATGDFCIEDI
jgi:hypothetical protein